MAGLDELLGDSVPNDVAAQARADRLAKQLVESAGSLRILDLGCGRGRSRALFEAVNPAIRWVGVDIINSPEVGGRAATIPGMVAFDGVRLPFPDASFDVVFTQQVLEHVRHPEPLLAEALRVLTPAGEMIGSTSHLEPYHSHSLWNFTPFGLKVIAEEAGFDVVALRPGIDGIALIERAYTGDHSTYNKYFSDESPLNRSIDEWASAADRTVRQTNVRKLAFSGHFTFHLRRPRAEQQPTVDATASIAAPGTASSSEPDVRRAKRRRRFWPILGRHQHD